MLLLQQLRVKEWIKNGFIFLPMFFAGMMKDLHLVQLMALGFGAFCFAASSIYCINDLVDVNFDKEHPIKKYRPYPSGKISTNQLVSLSAICMVIAAVLLFFLPNEAKWVLVAYIVLQLAYSFALKHVAVVDCVTIALGFVFRILFGGLILGSPGSSWIILVTFLLSLYLAFAKRRCELALLTTNQTRRSLQHYSLTFLDTALAATCAVTIVAYIMYTHDPEVITRIRFPYFYLSSGFVIVGMLRHLQQTIQKGQTESPTDYLFKDPVLIANILLWMAFNFYVLYGRNVLM
ncbi:MAG: UbiA prenyltransferase family protein [Chitinophagaceae bacterium]